MFLSADPLICQSGLTILKFISPESIAVLGPNGAFRNNSFAVFNPTKTTPPFFQIFNQEFLEILGENPSFHRVAQNTTFAFAHEAPIYFPETDEMFFGSNDGGALGQSDLNRNNKVGKISMAAVETALKNLNGQLGPVNVPVTEVRVVADTRGYIVHNIRIRLVSPVNE